MSQLTCLLGMCAFTFIAWLISEDRKRFPWRVVLGGMALQFLLAIFVLRTKTGRWLFERIGTGFERVMATVQEGTGFLFSAGADQSLLKTFAFGVLPTVIFFSSLMSILYHLGIMQKVVGALAAVMRVTLGTSGVETLAASANVFVGHTEAPLVVRPYLATMTRSELCAMMVGGFATVTGGLLGVYAGMGIEISHLLTASVISAPAGLLIAKVMVPEQSTGSLVTPAAIDPNSDKSEQQATAVAGEPVAAPNNLIGVAVEGASDGLKLALNVGAMLIAFLSLIALFDVLLAGVCDLLNNALNWLRATGSDEPQRLVPTITLGQILGYVCAPLAWLMGIPWSESIEAGRLIGIKTVANEFIAYADLGKIAAMDEAEAPLSKRSIAILTYALAGFSNFGAIGIQVGGIGGLEPGRRRELAQLGLKAMFGGALACCMTGAIAGMLL